MQRQSRVSRDRQRRPGLVPVKPGQRAATATRVNHSPAERCRSLHSGGHWTEVVPSHRLLTLSAGLRGGGGISSMKNRPDKVLRGKPCQLVCFLLLVIFFFFFSQQCYFLLVFISWTRLLDDKFKILRFRPFAHQGTM